jgi:hypothetical protein
MKKFNRIKAFFATEELAIADIRLKESNMQFAELQAKEHTGILWLFDYKGVCAIPKAYYGEHEAMIEAKAHFKTFQGNLKKDHSDTHWRYTKVVG